MFERHHQGLLPRRVFLWRLLQHFLFAILITGAALVIGVLGYHHFESMTWVDSFANAAMILSGMGPFGELKTEGGKVFAGCYALFSGLTFIVVVSTLLAPVLHRFMHTFHLDKN